MNYVLQSLETDLYKHNLYIKAVDGSNIFGDHQMNKEYKEILEAERKQIENAILILSKQK